MNMKTDHSFGIDFIIRKSKTERSKALIYARITVDEERREISLKESINPKDWDSKKEAMKGKSPEVSTLNHRIEDVRYRIRSAYRRMEEESVLITADAVKSAYLGVQSIQKGRKLLELMTYYRKIWEPKLKNGGFKNYRTTILYLENFLINQYPNKDLYLSQLSMEVATEFEHYVRNHPIKEHDPCIGNGVAKHVQRFKRLLNWAVELQWIKVNPFEKYSCPLKRNRRKKLTIQELVALEEMQLAGDTMELVRDLFVYSCYTGLAYVDAMALKESHFEWQPGGKVWCLLYRAKSDELCPVPLLNKAGEILKKYKYNPRSLNRGAIFPLVANQTVNKSLKILQEICGIETPMTFHVARHTFAKTVALKNGVPLETVQMMMGHTKITTTQIYADVDEEKILGDLVGIEERIAVKRDLIVASKNRVSPETRMLTNISSSEFLSNN